MSPQDELALRVRRVLADRSTREVAMFGGLSFMVDESLTVAARRDGSLLVRVDPAERQEVLTRPGAGPAAMKSGREMGERWLAVSPGGLADDAALASWIDVALRSSPQ